MHSLKLTHSTLTHARTPPQPPPAAAAAAGARAGLGAPVAVRFFVAQKEMSYKERREGGGGA